MGREEGVQWVDPHIYREEELLTRVFWLEEIPFIVVRTWSLCLVLLVASWD